VASKPKILGSLLAVVALALTGIGVAIAASDSNPGASSDSALALHGQNPKTATVALTISTGQQYNVTGTMDFNFQQDAARVTLSVPTVFSTTTVQAILKNHVLYFGSTALNSVSKKSWISSPVGSIVDLFPVEAEMAKAKVDVNYYKQFLGLAGIGKLVTTHNGPFTTYSVNSRHFPIPPQMGTPIKFPKYVTLSAAVTVAGAGQLSDLTVSLHSSSINFSIDLKVLSYNAPVQISAPPANETQKLSPAMSHQLFGSSASPLGQFLTPQQLQQLRTVITS
jgi:hypothetical protein